MSDVLQKIRALIARAREGGSEEESRTSAVQACRLILQHKIVLTLPGAPPEERSDEEIREAVMEYVRRKNGASSYRPRSAASARANAYGRAYGSQEERGRHTVHTPQNTTHTGVPQSAAPPFDPYDAPFEEVRDYVKARGIDLHENGDGTFSAHVGQTWSKGTWGDVVQFMFGLLQNGSAKVFWKRT